MTTVIAVIALVISIGNLLIQVNTWWHARHTVRVFCSVEELGIPQADGKPDYYHYVFVTVNNAGPPGTLERIDFEEAAHREGITVGWSQVPPHILGPLAVPGDSYPAGFTHGRFLSAGESASWPMTVTVAGGSEEAFKIRAVARFADGRRAASPAFWFTPMGPDGKSGAS